MGFLFFFFFFFFILPSSAKNTCPASACNSRSRFTVKFPFRLQDRQPQHCAYNGFDLSCNDEGITTLKLPQSDVFFVRDIDYIRQEIRLYAPSGCMANRLLKLNLSGSPFVPTYYTNMSFLSCSKDFAGSRLPVVECLSNSTNLVLATPSVSVGDDVMGCQQLFARLIPVPLSLWTPDGYFSDLEADLLLTWNVPYCVDCELKSGTCGFESNSSQRVACFDAPGTGNKGLRVFGIISFSVAFFTFAASFLICFVKASQMRTRMTSGATTWRAQSFDPAAVTPQPANVVAGLDETTLESYTKVVLGESCRLPGDTSDVTCPICLSEYTAKDTVKCIPECTHCFHADCIDEWLRLTGTCPICRNTPTPSPTHPSNL